VKTLSQRRRVKHVRDHSLHLQVNVESDSGLWFVITEGTFSLRATFEGKECIAVA